MSEKNRESTAWALVLLVLIVAVPLLWLGAWSWSAPGMIGMMGMTGYGWGLMFLIPLTFLVLVALGAYYLITEFARGGRSTPSSDRRILDTLKERYAKGEITRDQYLKLKEELGL